MFYAYIHDGPWELLEVLKGHRRPVSDQFRNPRDANVAEQAAIGRQLRLLAVAGIPPDRAMGSPLLQPWFKWRDADGMSHQVYVLKAKPSHWRLYCVVSSRLRRQILFLHAVKKKEQARDPQDQTICEHILEGVRAGRYESATLPIPGSRG